MTDPKKQLCQECEMPVSVNEYHPYAACLMFMACHDSETVEANLASVILHGIGLADDDKRDSE